MSAFKDFYNKLVESVFEPIFKWILELEWKYRACFLIAISASYAGWHFQEEVGKGYLTAESVWPVLFSDSELPLSEVSRDRLDRYIEDLTDALAVRWRPDDPTLLGWSSAQIASSLCGEKIVNKTVLAKHMALVKDTSCSCWPEYTRPKGGEHVGATSWVLLSLALYQVAPTQDEIEFLLANQTESGWWSLYPLPRKERLASTYATAWAVFALQELNQRNLIKDDTTKNKVNNAIIRGVAWLWLKQETGAAKWKDYPNGGKGSIDSESISGLVIHVLNRVEKRTKLQDLNQQWLNELSSVPPDPLDAEHSDTYDLADYGDKTSHFRLPWMLMATIDAYESGGILQKGKALRWIEKAMNNDFGSPTLKAKQWIAAENLFALKYLKSKSISGPSCRDIAVIAAVPRYSAIPQGTIN